MGSRIFFNENLCPAYQKLFRMIYKLKKQKAWSFHRDVFYKLGENSDRVQVSNENYLKESFPDFFQNQSDEEL
jgi:hypothetical protein